MKRNNLEFESRNVPFLQHSESISPLRLQTQPSAGKKNPLNLKEREKNHSKKPRPPSGHLKTASFGVYRLRMMCKVTTLTLLGGERAARPHEAQDMLAGDQKERKARSHNDYCPKVCTSTGHDRLSQLR